MKALTLYQPWASAIALGAKRIETRRQPLRHRGPLAIHAGRRIDREEMDYIQGLPEWNAVFEMYKMAPLTKTLPFGALLAVCELVDCLPVEEFDRTMLDRQQTKPGAPPYPYWTERQMGNYARGRYGLVLEQVRPLRRPIPYRGEQGLFNVPDHILMEALDG